jgi:hypothetical protein
MIHISHDYESEWHMKQISEVYVRKTVEKLAPRSQATWVGGLLLR